MLEQSLSTAGAVHVVVPPAAAGARLQRFAAAAFREHCLAAARQHCASARWVALPSFTRALPDERTQLHRSPRSLLSNACGVLGGRSGGVCDT
jgi:hypothetical protein